MAGVRQNEKIVLQSDWNSSLRKVGGAAWISYRKADSCSVHGELKCIAVSQNMLPYLSATDGFSVETVSKTDLRVSYESGEGFRCSCRFLAPHTTFSSIHQPRKAVTDIDVTEGGLGVSCDTDGKLLVWNTADGSIRRQLQGHYGDVYTCQYFPSGVVIISGGADMMLKIWSAENGTCAATMIGHRAGVTGVGIVERGRNVVSVSNDGSVRLWDCGRSSCIATIAEGVGGQINCCSVGAPSVHTGLPDVPAGEREILTEGKMVLFGVENGTFQGYGVHSKKKVFSLQCSDAVNCCTYMTSTSVACGTQDGQIYLVDLRNTQTPLQIIKEKRSAIQSLLPFDEKLMASTSDGSCFLLDVDHRSSLELTGPDCDAVYKVSTDGTCIYTACRDGVIRKYKYS